MMEDFDEVAEHELAGNRQADYSEKLTDDIQRNGFKILREPMGACQDNKEKNHTYRDSDEQVDDVVVGCE